jgi:NAD(P)-dependent dehydrogenase (short-subunit alcohol dehydrogenase family)
VNYSFILNLQRCDWRVVGLLLKDTSRDRPAALNMLTVHLAYELRGTWIKVNSANPGFTKTDLNGNRGTQPVEVGASKRRVWHCWVTMVPPGARFQKTVPIPGRVGPSAREML